MSNRPEGTKIQVNYGPNGTLINVYAESATELANLLGDLEGVDGENGLGELIAQVGKALSNGHAAPQQRPQPPQQAPQQQPWASPTASHTAPVQPPAAPAAPQSATPTCPHGQMVWRSGQSQKGPWQAWMCPAQKDDPSRCQPRWIR